ncbi:hypothetical protein VTK56DRAFT_8978 [Thermocarpiscus australiensis]
MTFDDSIAALLDTYANCISLLRAFKHGRRESTTTATQHQHAHLRETLKSDRALVERTYTSTLSESGTRLKKGDARAISALDRILKKLRGAIANLLRLSSKKDGLDLDYESLMFLSNASRVEAVKAIESLSRRLGSPSRSSVRSSPSSKASPSVRHKCGSQSKGRSSTPNPSKGGRAQDSPRKRPPSATKEGKATSGQQKSNTGRSRTSPKPLSPPPVRVSPPQSGSPDKATAPAPKRISIMSFSSDSTKLGEIPQRKWQSVHHTTNDPEGDEYDVHAVFPLRPYRTEVKTVKERGFLWLFGRRREG